MKRLLSAVLFVMASSVVQAQVANDADGNFDSTSYVETNNDSTTTTTSTVTTDNTNTNDTTITSTNTNTNTNTNTSTVDSTTTSTNTNTNTSTTNNTNTNTSTSTNTNTSTIDNTTTSTVNSTSDNTSSVTTDNTNTNTSTNTNTNTNTSTNTNTNTNVNTNNNTSNTTMSSTSSNTNANVNQNTSTSDVTQKIESPPPSAIAPTIMSGGNDNCTVTWSSSVQTQILGMSGGGHIRDINCERLKNSKALYNMGMKVAAVALMCQDAAVFNAMRMAGTPCPFDGTIGDQAQALWDEFPEEKPIPQTEETTPHAKANTFIGLGMLLALLAIL